MPDFVKIAEWAARHGMSRQAGYQAVERCSIPVQDGKVDALVADTLYKARTRVRVKSRRPPVPAGEGATAAGDAFDADPAAAGTRAPTDADEDISYNEARRRKEVDEWRSARLAYLKETGRLVDVDKASAEYARKISELRDALRQMRPQLVPKLVAAAGDQAKLARAVDDAVHQVLVMVSGSTGDDE